MYQQLTLPENHPFLTAETDLRSICGSALKPYGITYFNYLRFYDDGQCCLLTTHNNMLHYLFNHNVPVAAPVAKEIVKNKFNYFILPIGQFDQIIHDFKSQLNLAHFIDLVECYEGYFELFCFGSFAGNNNIINFYLNNMDFLNQFTLYFKEKTAKLLENSLNHLIQLPEIMFPNYKGMKPCLDGSCEISILNKIKSNNFSLSGKFKHITFTKRQFDCIKQLVSGRTAREAAVNLGLRTRTFEFYVNNIKLKLGCYKKSELIDIVLKYGSQDQLFR